MTLLRMCRQRGIFDALIHFEFLTALTVFSDHHRELHLFPITRVFPSFPAIGPDILLTANRTLL